jgi:hypothetical protein
MELVTTQRSSDGVWTTPLPDWDGLSTLVQVYGPSTLLLDPLPIVEVDEMYPTSIVVGCSTSGSVMEEDIVDDDLVVVISRFNDVGISYVASDLPPTDDQEQIGEELWRKLHANDPAVAGVLLFASGLSADGDALATALNSADQDLVVAGGLAGSLPSADGGFAPTWVLDQNRRPSETAACIVGFSGPSLIFRSAARGGWKPLGPERVATSADGNTLYELDGQPALDLYRDYLGDRASELPAVASVFPLAGRPATGSASDWAPAGVLSVDEENRSLQLIRKIPEGHVVQMLRGFSGELFEAAENAAQDLGTVDSSSYLALVTSCLGRRVTLGSRTADELSYVREALPDNVSVAGLYGMGEFSTSGTTSCRLYNYTMTLALLGEAER